MAQPQKYPILSFFEYGHLPPKLQSISQPCGDLAHQMAEIPADGSNAAEVVAGLRKLLEAKDCFVRAALAASEVRLSQEPCGDLGPEEHDWEVYRLTRRTCKRCGHTEDIP